MHSNINHQFIENPRLQTKEEMISALDNLPQDVYRVKGFVRFSDQQHVYLVQYAQGNIDYLPFNLKLMYHCIHCYRKTFKTNTT
ncbi:CobW C-terminal domain-containing protein [Staphylococcus epidermidis]|uniref:GTP-binding protein n=1 Tax=Staphylococcus epidermidis TaxID=1282 RepID=UPI00214B9011|nr:GTP-binding protein [Staphylococcus epidermidis]